MSYAHGTPFLNLAQTVGTDHRDWFDENAAKLDLDTKMKTLWDGAASTADILEQLQVTVSGLDINLSALQTVVDGHTTTLQTVNESLVLINSALSALNTDVHTKFDSAGIADPYDPTYGIYVVGDVVTYNGQRYKCTTAVSAAEPFDADKWLAEDIQTVIDGLNSDLSEVVLVNHDYTNHRCVIKKYGKIACVYLYVKNNFTVTPYTQVIESIGKTLAAYEFMIDDAIHSGGTVLTVRNNGDIVANSAELVANGTYTATILLQ